MREIEHLYELYRNERNESNDSKSVQAASCKLQKDLDFLSVSFRDDIFASCAVYAQAMEKQGFVAGFKMAWNFLKEIQLDDNGLPKESKEAPVDCAHAGDTSKSLESRLSKNQMLDINAGFAYAKVSKKNNSPSGLRFNSIAAAMFEGAERCDIYLRDGDILIYPDNHGHYAVSRVGCSMQRSIACGSIIKELGTEDSRFKVTPEGNHILVRSWADWIKLAGKK